MVCRNFFALGDTISPQQIKSLSQTREWQKQLLFVDRALRFPYGLISEKNFYISPQGRKNSESELNATINAFLKHWPDDDAHPACRYPGRLAWLKKQFRFQPVDNPRCMALVEWRKKLELSGLSLVFSSYHLNNPASMFGHTFFMLHRKNNFGRLTSPLLDYALNFAANPTTDFPLLYSLMGLTGFFPGTFSLMPYYMKVQEYNNFESRDLWEYRLNLTPELLETFVLFMWEIGPYPINYYYLDENCSYVLLVILERLFPKMLASENFRLYAIPSDTLRIVTEEPDVVTNIVYRPSSLNRFRQKAIQLNSSELEILKSAYESQKINSKFRNTEDVRRQLILDASIEYIDYKMKVAGETGAKTLDPYRNELLIERSKIKIISQPKQETVTDQSRPDLGHHSLGHGVFYRRSSENQNAVDYTFQPTLHQIETPYLGYSPDLQVLMLSLTLRQDFEKSLGPRLERHDLFNAKSLPLLSKELQPISWQFSITGERESVFDRNDCFHNNMRGGVGTTVPLYTEKLRLAILPILTLGFGCSTPIAVLKTGISATMLYDFSSQNRYFVEMDWNRHYLLQSNSQAENIFSLKLGSSLVLVRNFETRIFFERKISEAVIKNEFVGGGFWYW